jgi:hypothetical protein
MSMRSLWKLLLLSGLSTSTLTGCVLWPEGGRPEAMPGYGAKLFTQEEECAKVDNVLTCVRNKVRVQFEDYAKRRDHIEQYRNAENLALFGVGGAAGVNAVTKGSRKGLQTLGLTAAGIVGLDGVLKADAQYETYGAGVKALQCVMDADQGFRTLSSGLGLGDGATIRELAKRHSLEAIALWPYLRLESEDYSGAVRLEDVNSNLVSQRLDAEKTATAGFANLYESVTRRFGGAMRRVMNSDGEIATPLLVETYNSEIESIRGAERERAAAFDMRLAVVATDDATRAGQLMSALNDIRSSVSERLLYTNADLAGIYDKLKAALDKVKLPTPAPVTGGSGTGGVKPVATLINTQPAAVRAGLGKFVAQMEQARQDNLIARNANKPYQECLALAEKKGSGQGSGSQGGGPGNNSQGGGRN